MVSIINGNAPDTSQSARYNYSLMSSLIGKLFSYTAQAVIAQHRLSWIQATIKEMFSERASLGLVCKTIGS